METLKDYLQMRVNDGKHYVLKHHEFIDEMPAYDLMEKYSNFFLTYFNVVSEATKGDGYIVVNLRPVKYAIELEMGEEIND